MNLWIRSQDENILVIVSNLMLVKKEDSQVAIVDYIGLNAMRELGVYKTKKRAMEVLDEIQDIIISTSIIPIENNEAVTCGCGKIYKMPKE